jgi:hypothetical protein
LGEASGPASLEAFTWIVIGLVALLALVAMLLLAEPVGDLIAPAPLDFFDDPLVNELVRPEHAELVRVAVAIVAALVVAAAVAYVPARMLPSRLGGAAPALEAMGGAAAVFVVLVAWFSRSEPSAQGIDNPDYFTALAGIAALAFAALVVWLASSRRRLGHAWETARGALARRPVAAAIAVVVTVCFLLPSVFTESSLGDALPFILFGHLPGIFGDFVAVANGRTPGVDFASQYAALLPYALWPLLSLLDYSPAAFTIIATCLSGLALLAVWRLLALAARDELGGLALYVPVVALSVVPLAVVGDERLTNASQYQLLPERYLLPMVTAWVLARHVRGLVPRGPGLPIALAAVAAANNPEFGLPCLVATLIALALERRGSATMWAEVRPLLARAVVAVVAVAVLVCAIDLVRTGSLPSPATVLYYSRLFGSQGYGMIPMPVLGLHLAVFATFAGALIVAAVRARQNDDRPLTALLGFAGAFGLLAFVYYGGRSNGYSLIGLFPAWGLALALLTRLVVARLRGASDLLDGARRAGALGVCALAGFGLAVTTVTQVAAPWDQVSRIADKSSGKPNPFDLGAVERFVRERSMPGEPIAVVGSNGFLIAREVGVEDTSPIEDPVHFVAGTQVQDVIDALDDEGGSSIFVRDRSFPPPLPSISAYLDSAGFRPVAHDGASGTTQWQRMG